MQRDWIEITVRPARITSRKGRLRLLHADTRPRERHEEDKSREVAQDKKKGHQKQKDKSQTQIPLTHSMTIRMALISTCTNEIDAALDSIYTTPRAMYMQSSLLLLAPSRLFPRQSHIFPAPSISHGAAVSPDPLPIANIHPTDLLHVTESPDPVRVCHDHSRPEA